MPKNLPTPDFTRDPKHCKKDVNCVSGLRPYRLGSYRLEPEEKGEKIIVHNYGHGGAGITMSWGCAYEVKDIVQKMISGGTIAGTNATVIGAGVMGLTVASILNEIGMNVKIIAKSFPPNTTSNIAGGQFAPSAVNYEKSPDQINKMQRILRRSFYRFTLLIGVVEGIKRVDNYTMNRPSSFEIIPKDVVPEPEKLERLPFRGHTESGYRYKTLLIEPTPFLNWLIEDLKSKSVNMKIEPIDSWDDIEKLDDKLIINCMGLGSQEIFEEKFYDSDRGKWVPHMIGVKGSLIKLPPQLNKKLDYLYSVGRSYIFPRTDGVMVGGTFDWQYTDPSPDCSKAKWDKNKHPKNCNAILERIEQLFEDKPTPPSVFKKIHEFSVHGIINDDL